MEQMRVSEPLYHILKSVLCASLSRSVITVTIGKLHNRHHYSSKFWKGTVPWSLIHRNFFTAAHGDNPILLQSVHALVLLLPSPIQREQAIYNSNEKESLFFKCIDSIGPAVATVFAQKRYTGDIYLTTVP